MKKIIASSIILLLVIFLNSCTDKTAHIKSYQFDIYTWEWEEYGTSGTPEYQYIVAHNISDITADVVNNGAVLGYIGTSQGWIALPYTLTNSGYTTNINYLYVVGGVGITVKDSDLLSVPPDETLTFKMVVLTPKQMHLIDGVDRNNYDEVANVLGME